MDKEYEIIKYKIDNNILDIRIDNDFNTIWLTQKEISKLYSVSVDSISLHIKNIIKKMALSKSVVEESSITATDGKRYKTKLYNLDIILEIGSRIKSNNGSKLKQFIDDYFSSMDVKMSDIIVYNNGNVSLDVTVSPSEDTVWLSQKQIAELYETTQPNISYHIKNVLEENELDNSVYKDFLYTAMDGKTYQTTKYNLDMILAIGYRVKSKRAVEFRKWASNILKQYLLKGYAIDSNRIEVTRSIVNLENEVSNIKGNMEELKDEIEDIKETFLYKPIKEVLFLNGKYYDSYSFLCSKVKNAKKSILLIDPYFDIDGLDVLRKSNNCVTITICHSSKAKINRKDIEKYECQYGKIDVIVNDNFHNRYLFIDGDAECYDIGTSINNIGKRIFTIYKIEDKYTIKLILDAVVDGEKNE